MQLYLFYSMAGVYLYLRFPQFWTKRHYSNFFWIFSNQISIQFFFLQIPFKFLGIYRWVPPEWSTFTLRTRVNNSNIFPVWQQKSKLFSNGSLTYQFVNQDILLLAMPDWSVYTMLVRMWRLLVIPTGAPKPMSHYLGSIHWNMATK